MARQNTFKCLRKLVKSTTERLRVDNLQTGYDAPEGFLTLTDIECVDADGTVFEKYEKLLVANDVVRDVTGNHIDFTPYEAITHFEEKGGFLPSMALSCNILAKLFDKAVRKKPEGSYEMLDSEAKAALDSYRNYGPGWGWHAQNTLIAYGSGRCIHYPSDSDFTNNGGNKGINSTRTRHALEFSKDGLHDSKLEDILNGLNPELTRFLKQFTGLRDPEKLVEIGSYFGKPARLWFPWNDNGSNGFNEILLSWLGCNYGCNFNLYGNNSLRYCNFGASGVREPNK